MVNRSRRRLGSRLTPLVVPRDLLRDACTTVLRSKLRVADAKARMKSGESW